MARNTRIFSDIDLNFTAHPVTKDIVRRFDENAIKASLKNLVLTANYERPFHSEIGSPVRALLFETPSPMVTATLRKALIDMLSSFEPRVEIIDILVNYRPDNNDLNISILFKIINTERPLTLDVVLERTR
jgi:phage baseplate assembly protein W